MPIADGDLCLEIGSAPGGSCQRLLESGASVIAVDPADLDERIASNPKVLHVRARGRELKNSQFEGARWLMVDANVAPHVTLSTVESITRGNHQFRGLILTLKIGNSDWFERVKEYRERAKSWGFRYIKTRQLAFNRNEFCLVALKNKAVTRFG